MKTIVLLITVVSCITGCRTTELAETVAETVIKDNTDKHKLRPEIRKVWSLMDYPNHISQAASFRMTTITNISLNEVISFDLLSQVETDKHRQSGILHYRKRLVSAFYDNIDSAINKMNAISDTFPELDNSEIYRVVVRELKILNSQQADRSYLLLYSDLREKSDLWDSYVKESSTPTDIAKALNAQCPFPTDLRNITVFILFQPVDRAEEQSFRQMQEAYAILLKKAGAKIIVQSSNNLSEL